MYFKDEKSKIMENKLVETLLREISRNGQFINKLKLPDEDKNLGKDVFEGQKILKYTMIRNKIMEEDSWSMKQDIYKDLRQEFLIYKINFIDRANKLIKTEPSLGDKEHFEQATRAYFELLKIVNACQKNMAEALMEKHRYKKESFAMRLQFMQEQKGNFIKEINAFKDKIERVSMSIIEHQIYNPQQGASLNLKIAISHLTSFYNDAYDKAYGTTSFWRWVKNIFKNSDRAKELEFLNIISDHKDCNNLIRAQALSLVQNKIVTSEWFSSNSKLSGIIDNILKSSVTDKKGTHLTLAGFLSKNPLMLEEMPKTLKSYFNENIEDYSEELITRPLI